LGATAATAASKSASPASSVISASLAKRMSIRRSSISCRKLSRWREMQKLSDRVKAT
jgi:hypothetical protein